MATQSSNPDFTTKPTGLEIKDADPPSLVSETDSASVREPPIQDANAAHRNRCEASDAQREKVRYGAPDGPRQRKTPGKNYSGREPLIYPGHEATAQHLATPKPYRQFATITALARHFQVTRKTIYEWIRDPDVLTRATWLTASNKDIGDLSMRREWPRIAEAMVDAALAGDPRAAKFCERRAWAEDGQADSPISNMTIAEACRRTEDSGEIPTWLQRQIEEERIEADAGASDGRENGEPPKLGTDGE